jgi:hypothetical protein
MSYEIVFALFIGFLLGVLVDLAIFLYCMRKGRPSRKRKNVIETP